MFGEGQSYESYPEDPIKEEIRNYWENPETARAFSELQQNEKNQQVSEAVDDIMMFGLEQTQEPIQAANLGAGAHIDRYHQFFEKLEENVDSKFDWVDSSPYMLELAQEYLIKDQYSERGKVVELINSDMLDYLDNRPDEALDLAVMQYTLDHIDDNSLDRLFNLLSQKLKQGGRLVSTLTTVSPEIDSISTNARFLHQGQEFPDNETRFLQEGEKFSLKFFKESGNPESGYLEGGVTEKYYHSPERLESLAKEHGFDISIGDWKEQVPREKWQDNDVEQNVMILTKN